MGKPKRIENGSRRTFLRGIAAAPAIPALIEAEKPDTANAQGTSHPNAEVDAMASLVQIRFGKYLAAGDMKEIKRGLERNLHYSEALAKVKLTNADEPDFIFFPDSPLHD